MQLAYNIAYYILLLIIYNCCFMTICMYRDIHNTTLYQVTSSWFFILQLSQDARSNKHQIRV